ncbi:MAG: class I SAM-dependent methyltransferase [Actinobacteria bacterium]|nr:class I SAM-dependent methyltransferase [Actinomycetota bacterium]
MYEESIRDEFTHQTESFARSPVATRADTLDALVAMAPADPAARWLEVACGPGLISRALAGRVGSVHGVDLTPSMVEKAAAEARREGIENADFALGDATALDFEDASFDGAITRFSFHHIPGPRRVLEEMARVVRPGGFVIVADHLADSDRDACAWAGEIERLRDPSHWSCLTEEWFRTTGAAVGLELEESTVDPLEIDFEDWLARGSGAAVAAPLIERLLTEPPPRAGAFRVDGEPGAPRTLRLLFLACRWSRP